MKYKITELFSQREITGISSESRNIRPGNVFFALKGASHDGNNYIEDALKNGAELIFTDDKSKQDNNIVYFDDIKSALITASEILYPNEPKNIIAVTGTNGKSSVISYVHQILSLIGKSSISIGTIGIESTKKTNKNLFPDISKYTTPDIATFREILNITHKIGIENLSFEASSHGISQGRLGNVKLQSAAFTSFSQDHLEYHGTMENYLHAKLQLFSNHLKSGSEAVINSEIGYINKIKDFLIEKNIPYTTIGKNGDLSITDCQNSLTGQNITFLFLNKEYHFHTNIIGSFQANNILIAARLVNNLGIDFEQIIKTLPKLSAVTGRLQRITDINSIFQIFVDYAHTPDALQKSLTELQKVKKATGNLYVIFGCGGDRDKTKRPIMGKIASDIADHVIITDDNPRSENPKKIREEIALDLLANHKILDIDGRKNAIVTTISKLKDDDILLIAGKGHEDYQIIGDKTTRFSDIETANNAIKNI